MWNCAYMSSFILWKLISRLQSAVQCFVATRFWVSFPLTTFLIGVSHLKCMLLSLFISQPIFGMKSSALSPGLCNVHNSSHLYCPCRNGWIVGWSRKMLRINSASRSRLRILPGDRLNFIVKLQSVFNNL